MAKQYGKPPRTREQLPAGASFNQPPSQGQEPPAYPLSPFSDTLSAAIYLRRQEHELQTAAILLGSDAQQSQPLYGGGLSRQPDKLPEITASETDTKTPIDTEQEMIQRFMARAAIAEKQGGSVSVTPAGTRPVIPTGSPSPVRNPKPKDKKPTTKPKDDSQDISRLERIKNFADNHKRALGATALAAVIAVGSVNVLPPARAFAQGVPGIEKLVVFGDSNESANSQISPEALTAELTTILPEMTAIPKPLLDTPLFITEPLPNQTTPELSQQVNLTYTSPEGAQTTLDNMLRLTAPNVLLGALNFKIDPENLETSLKHMGDNNYELSLDAIQPEAVLYSGLKQVGTDEEGNPTYDVITKADLDTNSTIEPVTLGNNRTDYRWKSVTEAGIQEGNVAVQDYIKDTYGTDAAAINKALADNGAAIASRMSTDAVKGLFKEPLFLVAYIEAVQAKINGYVNSILPDGNGVNITVTYNDGQLEEFVNGAVELYAEYDVPLVSGMSYGAPLEGLNVPIELESQE